MQSWRLEDAAKRAREAKYTFYKAGESEIAKIKRGENVKLIFAFDDDNTDGATAERMWVIVDEIDGGGGFVGRLDNEPRWIRDLAPGDRIEFRDIHIINTEHDDQNNIIEKYLPRCFVTNRILKGGEKVGYLYREDPDNERDSGWRLMVGDESQDYIDDSGNISYVSLGAVLNMDDSIIHLLEFPSGSAFEWDEEASAFIGVEG